MRYRDYLALEGSCSIVLGLALALVSFPGLLLDDWDGVGYGLLFVPAVLLALAAYAALRRGVGLLEGLSERPVRRGNHLAAPGLIRCPYEGHRPAQGHRTSPAIHYVAPSPDRSDSERPS